MTNQAVSRLQKTLGLTDAQMAVARFELEWDANTIDACSCCGRSASMPEFSECGECGALVCNKCGGDCGCSVKVVS